MTITAWRLVQAQYSHVAFSGEGASRYPGRWNQRGTRMVYMAGSLSLATLEILVNLDGPTPLRRYVAMPAAFESSRCLYLDASNLPADWQSDPPPSSTRAMGTDWAKSNASLALGVPSCVVPLETNYLINPQHPDFKLLAIGKAEPFEYDRRLFKH